MKVLGRFALPLAVACLSSAGASAEQIPPQEGCRLASKIEYDSAKRQYLLISRFGRMSERGISGGITIGGVIFRWDA
jgi:hypothetical protein